MDEFISREAFKGKYLCCGYLPEMSEEEFDQFPAADVAPVVHGLWIHDGCRIEGGIDWCHCSECGKSDNFCAHTNYYPNCGTKMDGKEGAE